MTENTDIFRQEAKFLSELYPELLQLPTVALVDGDLKRITALEETFSKMTVFLCAMHKKENTDRHLKMPTIKKGVPVQLIASNSESLFSSPLPLSPLPINIKESLKLESSLEKNEDDLTFPLKANAILSDINLSSAFTYIKSGTSMKDINGRLDLFAVNQPSQKNYIDTELRNCIPRWAEIFQIWQPLFGLGTSSMVENSFRTIKAPLHSELIPLHHLPKHSYTAFSTRHLNREHKSVGTDATFKGNVKHTHPLICFKGVGDTVLD